MRQGIVVACKLSSDNPKKWLRWLGLVSASTGGWLPPFASCPSLVLPSSWWVGGRAAGLVAPLHGFIELSHAIDCLDGGADDGNESPSSTFIPPSSSLVWSSPPSSSSHRQCHHCCHCHHHNHHYHHIVSDILANTIIIVIIIIIMIILMNSSWSSSYRHTRHHHQLRNYHRHRHRRRWAVSTGLIGEVRKTTQIGPGLAGGRNVSQRIVSNKEIKQKSSPGEPAEFRLPNRS